MPYPERDATYKHNPKFIDRMKLAEGGAARDRNLDIAGIVASVAPVEQDKRLDPGMVISSEPPPTYFRKGIYTDPDQRHMDNGMPIDETKFPLRDDRQVEI